MKKTNNTLVNNCSFYIDLSREELDDLIKTTFGVIIENLTGDSLLFDVPEEKFNKMQLINVLVTCENIKYRLNIAISNKVVSAICDAMLGGDASDATETIDSQTVAILGVAELLHLLARSIFLNIPHTDFEFSGIIQSFDDVLVDEFFSTPNTSNLLFEFKSHIGIIRTNITLMKED